MIKKELKHHENQHFLIEINHTSTITLFFKKSALDDSRVSPATKPYLDKASNERHLYIQVSNHTKIKSLPLTNIVLTHQYWHIVHFPQ